MNSAGQLPLDDPRWSALGTFGVPPERIPVIIRRLLEGPANPDDPAFDELAVAIFHQYSLADATYVVLPYLVDIYARYGNVNPRIFYLAANIAASADIDKIRLPAQVRQGFLDGLARFETIAVSKVLEKTQPVGEIYNATAAGIAFSRHCCGKLLTDVLDAEDAQHTALVCPQCHEHIEVMLFEEGAVVIESGPDPQPPDPPRTLNIPVFGQHPERRPNLWRAVSVFLSQESQFVSMCDTEQLHMEGATRLCGMGVSSDVPPEEIFSLIGAILVAHGFSSNARRFFRLWDSITCPKCGAPFVAGKRWWGCVE
jgi:hypothetical protein